MTGGTVVLVATFRSLLFITEHGLTRLDLDHTDQAECVRHPELAYFGVECLGVGVQTIEHLSRSMQQGEHDAMYFAVRDQVSILVLQLSPGVVFHQTAVSALKLVGTCTQVFVHQRERIQRTRSVEVHLVSTPWTQGCPIGTIDPGVVIIVSTFGTRAFEVVLTGFQGLVHVAHTQEVRVAPPAVDNKVGFDIHLCSTAWTQPRLEPQYDKHGVSELCGHLELVFA